MEKHHKVADHDHETSKGLLTKTKAYKQFGYRWIILFCYLSVAFINGIGYQSFIPNAKQFINLYSVGEQIITLTGTIFLIMQPVFTFFASTFIVKFGFAVSMNFGVFLTIIGYSLRLLINEFSFTFAIIGQACLGIGRPFIINGQTSLAQNWFFPSNRTAVITTCNAFQTVSMVISVLWPANWVFKNYEYSTENKGEGLDLAMTLVKQQFYLSLALIPGMFLVRNNPKTPPSGFANSDKDIGFKESIVKLFTNKNFILIFLTFSIFFGTVKGFGLAVPYLMSPFGFVDNQYSIVSSMLVIGGFLSAGLVSKIVLKFKKYKAIGIVLFSISIILALLTYPLLLLGNIYLLYIQQLLLGFFLIPMVPVLVEYSCESIYPLNGSFSVGVMVSGSTILALLSSMLLTYTVKGKDSDKISVLTTTTIWCLFYISGFLLYLFTKEILNRSREIEERAASKHSLFFGQSQLKASINQPEEDEIIGDYPTEHPVADSHQFMANPEVFDPDYIIDMQDEVKQ